MTIKSNKIKKFKLPKINWKFRRPNLYDNPTDITLYIIIFHVIFITILIIDFSVWGVIIPIIIGSVIINTFDSTPEKNVIGGFVAAFAVNLFFSVTAFFIFFIIHEAVKYKETTYQVVRDISIKDFTQTDKFKYSITEKRDNKPIVLSIDAEKFLKLKSCNPAIILKTTSIKYRHISKKYDSNISKLIVDCDNGYPHER